MKTIGLLGGMSWESSLEYYRLINEFTKEVLGDTHSAEIIMHSFDFHNIDKLQHEGKWNELSDILIEKSKNLKNSGADFIVLCTNTMHKLACEIEKEVGIDVLHIAKSVGRRIIDDGLEKVLLLGTKFTMEGEFYSNVLKEMGVDVIIPKQQDRVIVHDTIYNELILGELNGYSRERIIDIINEAVKNGVQGVVLGCTELPLLIKQEHLDIPVYDTMTIHCRDAVNYANKKKS